MVNSEKNGRLAVIDIGSNAIRLQVSQVLSGGKIKRLEYVRFPLRLGTDVFEQGEISPYNAAQFVKLMQAFKLLLDIYHVEDYRACATSAMRDSSNGALLAALVEAQFNLHIQVIDGAEEARLLGIAMQPYIGAGSYLHIDVGGGSTEVNFYQDGVLKDGASFQLGSIRGAEKGHDFAPIDAWLEKTVKTKDTLHAVGTGGNIGKLVELIEDKKDAEGPVNVSDLEKLVDKLETMSHAELTNDMGLNADRADVIVPAGKIYLHVLQKTGAKIITAPDVGLKDGILAELVEGQQAV